MEIRGAANLYIDRRGVMRRSNENIEVLRCFLMFLIVLMHVATFVPTGSHLRARLIHVFCIFSVNAFALISGWFGVRFSWRKIMKLLGLGLFSSLVLLALSPLAGHGFQFSYDLGWFGCSYLGLLFLAPILNAAVDKLRGESESALRVAWCIYAIAMMVSWVPLDFFHIHFHIPGWQAHSMNQLIFMYLTGRVLVGCGWIYKVRYRMIVVLFLSAMALNYGWAILAGVTRHSDFLQALLVGTRCYNNPIVIILGISAFVLFLRARMPSWFKKAGLFMGPSMFSVYLLHEATNHELSVALYKQIPVCLGRGAIQQLATIFIIACLVYFICIGLDILRRIVLQCSK